MAVGVVELVHGRTVGRFTRQRLRPRPVWLSADNDVLHGMDGAYDLHPGFRAFFARLGLGRGDVRSFVGCFPGWSISSVICIILTRW
jgi:hypothetical protein